MRKIILLVGRKLTSLHGRKVILLVGSFVVFLALFGLYSLFGPVTNVEDEIEIQGAVKRPVIVQKDPDVQSPEPTEGTMFWSEDRDPYTGKLKRIYRVKQWSKKGEGIYELVEPNVVIYQRNGQQVTIRADQGQVVGEEIGGKPQVQSGLLEGNVKIYFDRDDEVARHDEKGNIIPAEKRPNVVRIYVDTLRFNASDLEIYSDSPVKLYAKEADIFGKGLRLLWKENPQELRRLEIKQGERMVVHQAAESGQILALPGKDASAQGGEDSKTITPDKSVAAAEASNKASTPQNQDDKTQRKNVFLAEFFADVNNIQVNHQDQSLIGARRLAMQFEFTASSDAFDEGRDSAPADPQPQDISPAKTQADASKTNTWQPAPQPSKPLIITWDGPLVLQPVGYTELPSKKHYTIEAQGDDLILSDSQTTVLCQALKYKNSTQSGEFYGSEDGKIPALIKLEGGEEIVAGQISFDRINGVANLIGKGYMLRTQDDSNEGGEKITWKDSVLVDFVPDESVGSNRVFIKKASFQGDVLLTQDNNLVRGDKLVVAMGKTPDGKIYPTRADVTGNAFATQESSNISAEHISVTFRPVAGQSGKAVVKGYSQSARVEPVELKANGNVEVTDKRNSDVVFANADELVSDLIVAKAILKGNPARVGQGPNILSGKKIDMWQREFKLIGGGRVIKKNYVEVTGEGNLVFLTDRGMNSAKLDQPRKIRVDWKDRMSYYPQQMAGSQAITDRNTAQFRGDVVVTSLYDRLASQFLEVQFLEKFEDKKDSPSTQPARRTGAVEIAGYSSQELVKMDARDNVEMAVIEKEENNTLLGRMVLNGDDLVYDVPSGVVNMFSGGTLMNEDYRQPKEGASSSSPGETNVDRPNLTSFAWSDSMVLNQNARQAVLKGDVSMTHRSGQKIVDIARLSGDKLPQWTKLPEGRHTKIRCEDMLVQFDEPDRDKKVSPQDEGAYGVGSKIGALNLFKATGNVRMEDGPRQVISQILIYDRVSDIVKIFGYIEGRQSPANAMLIETNLREMTEKEISSPVIIWYRKNNEVRTGTISAGG